MKILLFEDDRTMRSILTTLLQLEGFEVVSISFNPNVDYVQAVRDEIPDILLLDVHLRDLNGFDVLKNLRDDPTTRQTRIVMTSGMDLRDQCKAAGADGFILKPYMPDELIQTLKDQLV